MKEPILYCCGNQNGILIRQKLVQPCFETLYNSLFVLKGGMILDLEFQSVDTLQSVQPSDVT